jgi:hypothetical protein
MGGNAVFQRNDIYYCSCCAKFYNNITHERVHVAYHELPAEMAMQVMNDRIKVANQDSHETRRKRAKKR